MKKFYFLLLAGLALSSNSKAQYDCNDGRFTDWNYFSNFDVDAAVEFGSGPQVVFPPSPNAPTQALKMDIYEPQGDTMEKRPLIIMEFGGSFVAGAREDLAPLCEIYSKMGYVAATIDYRVGFFYPNEVTSTQAVVRAMHDMKAAIRYFYKDAQTTNTYKIDTNFIFVSGVSAGAIGAIHTAYMDDNSEIPAYLYDDTAGMGGVEGLSGNPGYSTKVTAVVNFSGLIGDTAWINAGDIPIVSVHDIGDNVVPYHSAMVDLGGFPTGLEADGSGSIHRHMNDLQIPNRLITVDDDGHVSYFTSGGNLNQNQAAQTAVNFSTDFMKDILCGNLTFEPSHPDSAVVIADTSNQNSGFAENDFNYEVNIYPNPVSNGSFTVAIPGNTNSEILTFEIIDITGRMVSSQASTSTMLFIDRNSLPAGLYNLIVRDEKNNFYVEKLIFK